MGNSISRLLAAAAFAGAVACTSSDISYPIERSEDFIATMNGANEIPAVTTAATGTAYISVIDDTILTYRVDVSAIDSTTASHIHTGTADSAGAIVVTLFTGASACKQNLGGVRTIISSSVANPTVITIDSSHGQAAGSTPFWRIAGHTSTPSINGEFTATTVDSLRFTVPVDVTAGGTGGTAQRFQFVNLANPRCIPGFSGPLNQAQQKYSALTGLPAAWGTTARERFDTLVVRMRTGRVYVNVHNRANAAGHIRGQVGPR